MGSSTSVDLPKLPWTAVRCMFGIAAEISVTSQPRQHGFHEFRSQSGVEVQNGQTGEAVIDGLQASHLNFDGFSHGIRRKNADPAIPINVAFHQLSEGQKQGLATQRAIGVLTAVFGPPTGGLRHTRSQARIDPQPHFQHGSLPTGISSQINID